MEIEESDEIDSNSVTDEILSLHHSKKTIIYSLHAMLNQFELHLDGITNKYKSISITLLLATYAAIGFVFSIEAKDLQINKLLVSSLVCFFGVIGITSLWYLDIYVFQKFWGAFFIEEVKMEKKHNFLIKIGDLSMSLDDVKARINGHGNFYVFVNILLIVTAGISISFITKSVVNKIFILSSYVILSLIVAFFMRSFSKKLLYVIKQLMKDI